MAEVEENVEGKEVENEKPKPEKEPGPLTTAMAGGTGPRGVIVRRRPREVTRHNIHEPISLLPL